MPIMPDIGTISVDQVVEQSLVIRNRDLKQNYSEIFWKVVVSSPDKEESPYYSDPVSDWIETIFCEQPLSDEDLYLLEVSSLVMSIGVNLCMFISFGWGSLFNL